MHLSICCMTNSSSSSLLLWLTCLVLAVHMGRGVEAVGSMDLKQQQQQQELRMVARGQQVQQPLVLLLLQLRDS